MRRPRSRCPSYRRRTRQAVVCGVVVGMERKRCVHRLRRLGAHTMATVHHDARVAVPAANRGARRADHDARVAVPAANRSARRTRRSEPSPAGMDHAPAGAIGDSAAARAAHPNHRIRVDRRSNRRHCASGNSRSEHEVEVPTPVPRQVKQRGVRDDARDRVPCGQARRSDKRTRRAHREARQRPVRASASATLCFFRCVGTRSRRVELLHLTVDFVEVHVSRQARAVSWYTALLR